MSVPGSAMGFVTYCVRVYCCVVLRSDSGLGGFLGVSLGSAFLGESSRNGAAFDLCVCMCVAVSRWWLRSVLWCHFVPPGSLLCVSWSLSRAPVSRGCTVFVEGLLGP